VNLTRFRDLKLGAKLNIVISVALSILLVIVVLITLASTLNSGRRAGQQRAAQEAEVIPMRFEEAKRELLVSTELLGSQFDLIEAVVRGDTTAIRSVVLAGAAQLDLDDVIVVDSDGDHLTTAQEGAAILQTAQQDDLISPALRGNETADIVVAGERAELYLTAAVPLCDTSDEIIGALLASVRVDDEFLARINLSRKNVHLALIAGDHILAQDLPTPEHLEEFSTPLLKDANVERALSGETVVRELVLFSRINKASYVLAYTPLVAHGDTRAVIAILVELSASQLQLAISLAVAFTVLILVTVHIAGLFVRRNITAPIAELTSAAEQMAGGDYGQTANVKSADELGQLAGAFNVMTGAIQARETELQRAYQEVEIQVQERTAELQRETGERERLQQEIIAAQKQALRELSTPIIPVMDRIIVMPLIGNVDSARARDITRSLLAGIREHRAKVVILDITGVPLVDSGVASHLNKTIHAARLKGARTIVSGISDAVAETIVDLGIDWNSIETVSDLQTGLVGALDSLGIKLTR
jgi:anti-anti-sigma regulatory factor/HAMP domain-containing protein